MNIGEFILSQQIDFNNQWPAVELLDMEPVRVFKQRLIDRGVQQIFVPMQWDKEKSVVLFRKKREVAKIYSSILDVYDVLPLHPDIAFDVVWRALEISMKFLSINSWGYLSNRSFEDILKRTISDIIIPITGKEKSIETLFERLFENVSLVSLRYLVARLFFKMDLSVSPQVEFVRKRANDLFGNEVVGAIKAKYVDAEGNMDAANQRNAARLLWLILKGQRVNINGTDVKPFALPTRIEFYVSCVLYSSRCERFHGDYYSPLKSSLTDLATFYEYYYLLIFSYALWGVIMNKIQLVYGIVDALSVESVCSSINEMLDRIAILPNK